jgi:hypothetical protein
VPRPPRPPIASAWIPGRATFRAGDAYHVTIRYKLGYAVRKGARVRRGRAVRTLSTVRTKRTLLPHYRSASTAGFSVHACSRASSMICGA